MNSSSDSALDIFSSGFEEANFNLLSQTNNYKLNHLTYAGARF